MLIIAGLVIVVAGIILHLVRRRQKDKIFEIASTETSTSRALGELAKVVAKELGESGSFIQSAEVKGLVKCDAPLTSEVAKQPCVYYESSVTQEYEETYWETNASTQRQERRTRRGSETLASNKQGVPFWVEDSTSRIRVDPEGAGFDAVQTVDRFEQPQGGGGMLSIGNFALDLNALPLGWGRRTLGYRLREKVLPLDRRVYVLGEASDARGELTIRKPREKGKRFIISAKSEEELIRSANATAQWLLYGEVACVALGIVLILAGLFRVV